MVDQPIVWSRHKAGIAAASGAAVVVIMRMVVPWISGTEPPQNYDAEFIESVQLLGEMTIGALIVGVAVERMPNRPVPSTGDGA